MKRARTRHNLSESMVTQSLFKTSVLSKGQNIFPTPTYLLQLSGNEEHKGKLMHSTIETIDLTRRFNSLTAVDKLNITVEKGEVFGLLGPNGAGKTTTISMLCTILRPTSGIARVNGFDVAKQATQVRKSIGIVFQDPSIDDRLTGRENLYMHANLYGVPPGEQRNRIEGVLKLVELEERADDLLRAYSGGMRRRLEIARGLIHYPKVLFLDEPTIGLDPQEENAINGLQLVPWS